MAEASLAHGALFQLSRTTYHPLCAWTKLRQSLPGTFPRRLGLAAPFPQMSASQNSQIIMIEKESQFRTGPATGSQKNRSAEMPYRRGIPIRRDEVIPYKGSERGGPRALPVHGELDEPKPMDFHQAHPKQRSNLQTGTPRSPRSVKHVRPRAFLAL